MKRPVKSTIPICLDGKIVGTCSSMRLSNEPNEGAPDAPYTYYAENFVPCEKEALSFPLPPSYEELIIHMSRR